MTQAVDTLNTCSLRPGDKVPFCYGMTGGQAFYSFEDQAGRSAVLLLAGSNPPSAVAGLLEAFCKRLGEFAALRADICVLAKAGAPGWATAVAPAGATLVHCMDGPLLEAALGSPKVLVMDRATRLLAQLDGRDPAAVAEAALTALGAPFEPAREVVCPAPVLIVPGVLDRDTCERLIRHFEAGAHIEGAMASVDLDGAPVSRVDAAKKQRRDLTLDPAEGLHAEVLWALSTRLVPEIAKAFQVNVAHLDRILIARYDHTGGYFRRHRDNSSAHLAFREFALSVNLNTGDYEGGELLFAEYNDHRHSPPLGAGLVFSASLLHEAAPVTRGSRYVLLTFLHSHAAEEARLASLGAAA